MLSSCRGAPLLVIELPFVSQRISGFRFTPHEERTTNEIAEAMNRHGLKRATFVVRGRS